MQPIFKKILPHVLVFLGFIILSLAYFSPVLSGKQILQSDIVQYNGMAKQQRDFKAETGQETYWTNGAFAGMPTYQLGAKYPHNYIKKIDSALRFLPRPADYLFLYFIGFYILLLSLKVDFKLAALGALAFGFSTYLVIILGVGHNSKAHAIAYMPLVLSGIVLTFRKKYLLGFIVTAIAMGLELVANHFQMTYYLLILVIIVGIVYLIDAYCKKVLPHFLKSVGIMVVAVIFAIGMNATNILATKQYVKQSTRGKSELTINADGTQKTKISSGLDKAYITQFSYGVLESFNLFIPRLFGGGNGETLGQDSATYNAYRKLGASPSQALEGAEHAPMYWGNQPIVEAPAYIGAVIIFLFVFALFLVKGRLKWWLVCGIVLSLLLSFGKNLAFLTNFFIDYVPLYNKFRAVSSIQVILEVCIPVLAIFGLVKLFNDFNKKEEKLIPLVIATVITAGIAILFLVFKSLFNFEGVNDGFYKQNYGPDFLKAIIEDRKSIYTSDTLRSLVLVLLSAGLIYMYLKNKLKDKWLILAFAVLVVIDLVGVDRRYVNTDNFVSSLKVKQPFTSNAADQHILKDKDNFRVFDLIGGAAKPSFYHNSLNGYNAAELKKYREVFDFYISKNNMSVLNMLNTKYIIVDDPETNKPFPFKNEEANGNAWFVSELQKVGTADQEILALEKLDTKNMAVYTSETAFNPIYKVDSLANINVVKYLPNYIKYESNNTNNGFAVFSEVYYGNGWIATIDDKVVPIHRVNYVLRGLEVPKGKHTITFKFNPQVVKTGSSISLASSILFFLLVLGGLFYTYKRKNE